MRNREKNRACIGLALNLINAVLVVVGLWMCSEMGWLMLQYYTQDSNIIAMAACLVMAVYQIRYLRSGREIPMWVYVFQYISVCLVCVTFLVVVFVLSPMYASAGGFSYMMFSGAMLFHHCLCPIIALVSFLLCSSGKKIDRKHTMMALIPTFVYGAVAIALNILNRLVGPYPFLMVKTQSVYMSVIWSAVILGMAYLIAWTVRKLYRKDRKKSPESGTGI